MKISTTPKKPKKGLTGQNLMTQCYMSISLRETGKVRQDKKAIDFPKKIHFVENSVHQKFSS